LFYLRENGNVWQHWDADMFGNGVGSEGRGIYGTVTLLRELDAEDPEMFRRYHRVDQESFHTILAMVDPQIHG